MGSGCGMSWPPRTILGSRSSKRPSAVTSPLEAAATAARMSRSRSVGFRGHGGTSVSSSPTYVWKLKLASFRQNTAVEDVLGRRGKEVTTRQKPVWRGSRSTTERAVDYSVTAHIAMVLFTLEQWRRCRVDCRACPIRQRESINRRSCYGPPMRLEDLRPFLCPRTARQLRRRCCVPCSPSSDS